MNASFHRAAVGTAIMLGWGSSEPAVRRAAEVLRAVLRELRMPDEDVARAGYEAMERATGRQTTGGMKSAFMAMIDELAKP